MCVHIRRQLANRDVQRGRDAVDVDESEVALAALDITDVCAVDTYKLGQALLRDACGFPVLSDGFSESDLDTLGARHTGMSTIWRTMGLQTISGGRRRLRCYRHRPLRDRKSLGGRPTFFLKTT